MDLISIIVPVYNVEKYIHQCVDSIIDQTYTNLEIILVDDGSPDNCGKICDEYAQKDSRIKVIHKENGGLSDARNHGIDAATGDWLMFIDSDDWIEADMAEKLLVAAERNNAMLAVGGVVLFEGEQEYIPSYYSIQSGCVDARDILNKGGMIPTAFVIACNKLFRKELFAKLRFPCGMMHEDEATAHYFLTDSGTISVIDKPLYHYRQTSGSISHTITPNRLDYLLAFSDRIRFYHRINLSAESYELQRVYISELIYLYFRFQKKAEFRNKLKSCKKDFLKTLPWLLKNSSLSLKEKISMLCFAFFPNLYKTLWFNKSYSSQFLNI